ncbi:MAG: hypothetical protein IJU99_09205, partial [Lachnospiraceae bacterium]|nr:hypothetical protein [Lachnospiraceae bacterium]
FARIAGWKDADDRYSTCGQEIEKLQAQIEEERIAAEKKAEEERIAREEREAREKKEAEERAERERIEAEERRAKNIKMAKIFGPIAAAAVIFLILLTKVILPSSNYKKAAEAMAAEDYKTAVTLYTKLGSYKDSAELLPQAQIGSDYDDAKALLDEGKYQEAIAAFQAVIKSYDALQKGSKPDSGKEEPATMRPAEDTPETPSQKPADTPANVDPAKETIVEDSYKNSRSLLREAQNGLAYEKALDKLNNKRYDDAIKAFTDLGSYKDSPDQLKESYYCKALSLLDKGKNEEAEEILLALGDYKDALDKAGGSTYQRAQKLMSEEQYAEAAALFTKLGNYKDSADQAKECSYQAAVASLVPITDYLKNGPSPEEIAIAAAAGIPLDEKAFTEESYYALMAQLRETFLSLGSYKDSAKYAAHFFRRVIAVNMKSLGNTNYRHYDLSGRISTDEYSFRYIYNTSGKLDSVGLTKLTYNEAGQFVSISGLNVTLNDAGLPAAYDAPAQYNKVSYRFTYDSQGRLIERTRNSGTDNAYTKENITVTYDASGDITEIKQVTENKNYSGVRTSEAIRVPVYGYIYCSAADEAPDTAVDPLLYHQ